MNSAIKDQAPVFNDHLMFISVESMASVMVVSALQRSLFIAQTRIAWKWLQLVAASLLVNYIKDVNF